ncbi:MAG: LysR family transcriptional regulator [Rhizobiaceae bacterium]
MTNVTLAQLRTFIALVDTGSFHAASDMIGRGQPAVSSQIKKLEQELGLKLLYRNNRNVALTAEGSVFLGRLRRTIADLDGILADVGRVVALEAGEVRVGAAPTLAVYILPEVVQVFRTRYPELRVTFSDENTPMLGKLVFDGNLDFYIGPRPMASNPLTFRKIAEDQYVALVASAHPLASQDSVSVEDLAQEDWLLMKEGTSLRRETERLLERHALQVRVIEEVANHFTLGSMVAAGCGVAILPSTAIPLAMRQGVSVLPLKKARLMREIGVACRRDYVAGPPASAFLDIAVPLVRERCRDAPVS